MPAKKRKTKVKAKTKAKTKRKAKSKTRVKVKRRTKAKIKTKRKTKAKSRSKAKPKSKAKARVKTKRKTAAKAGAKAKSKAGTRAGKAAKAAPAARSAAACKTKVKKLGKRELNAARARIQAERQRIIRELDRIEETISDAKKGQEGANQSYSNHLADIGTDYMEQEKNFYYASQEGYYLRSLDEALERIERGLYGICESCGCRIGAKRLEAVPSARQCIKCKSESEKNNRGR